MLEFVSSSIYEILILVVIFFLIGVWVFRSERKRGNTSRSDQIKRDIFGSDKPFEYHELDKFRADELGSRFFDKFSIEKRGNEVYYCCPVCGICFAFCADSKGRKLVFRPSQLCGCGYRFEIVPMGYAPRLIKVTAPDEVDDEADD